MSAHPPQKPMNVTHIQGGVCWELSRTTGFLKQEATYSITPGPGGKGILLEVLSRSDSMSASALAFMSAWKAAPAASMAQVDASAFMVDNAGFLMHYGSLQLPHLLMTDFQDFKTYPTMSEFHNERDCGAMPGGRQLACVSGIVSCCACGPACRNRTPCHLTAWLLHCVSHPAWMMVPVHGHQKHRSSC
jgi:hypothetical protein